VQLTARSGPAAPRTVVSDLVIPAGATLTLSPFGDDIVLQDPGRYENQPSVPLTLTFRNAGTVTIDATVTAPGTP
jgi:copper(I)-binding protein